MFMGLYAVQEGYMDVQGVICCSGGLYGCSGGLSAVQEGYMMKKLMMVLVATNVIASGLSKRRRIGTQISRAKDSIIKINA